MVDGEPQNSLPEPAPAAIVAIVAIADRPIEIGPMDGGGWKTLVPLGRWGAGVRVCGAKTRHGRGRRATDDVLRCVHAVGDHPSRRCHMHSRNAGGPVKHGRYSKYPGKLGLRIEAARDDPRLLDMRGPIAALDVAVHRAVQRVEDLDTPAMRRRALDLYDESFEAQRGGDPQTAARALNDLGVLLRRGAGEDRAFRDLVQSAIDLSKRQEAAWKITLDSAQAVNVREMVALLRRAFGIVEDEIEDKAAVMRVERRFEVEVIGLGGGGVKAQKQRG